MRNQRRVTEEQEALQRWKSLQGLEHEPPTGTCIHLSQRLLCSLNYFISYMCLGKTQQNPELVFHLVIFRLISFFALYISNYQPSYSNIHNFPLVYFFPSCQPHTLSMLFCVLLTAHYLSLHCLLSIRLSPHCSRPTERRRPGRAGWRSTPSPLTRVSPRWSPVHLTSTSPTDTAESTSRHAALPHSRAMGNHHCATLCCSCTY